MQGSTLDGTRATKGSLTAYASWLKTFVPLMSKDSWLSKWRLNQQSLYALLLHATSMPMQGRQELTCWFTGSALSDPRFSAHAFTLSAWVAWVTRQVWHSGFRFRGPFKWRSTSLSPSLISGLLAYVLLWAGLKGPRQEARLRYHASGRSPKNLCLDACTGFKPFEACSLRGVAQNWMLNATRRNPKP